MGIIHKLDPHLVNQIAAGEVIERPASVVKELLENSIDAESTRIEIAVEEGGKKLIRIQDDGIAMDADDLALAVDSHATSKLRSSDDLDHIATFGFRGEALSSVGSVSQMTITTRRHDAIEGHAITLDGGRLDPVRVAGGPPGTIIEVRNLFFNVPARRKFLKTDATELGHIVDAVANVALAFPAVAFRLTHNGRTVYDLPSADGVRDRVGAFFGRDLADKLIEVRATSPAGDLWGLAAPPSESRASTRMQFLYVNGRYVRDRSLFHAIREAYRGLLEVNRQPIVFLYLTVPHGDVDVNVHPTKIEVRLRCGQQIYREVLAGLRERFLSADLAPRVEGALSRDDAGAGLRLQPEATPPSADSADREAAIRRSMADFLRSPPVNHQSRFSYPGAARPASPGGSAADCPRPDFTPAAPPRFDADAPPPPQATTDSTAPCEPSDTDAPSADSAAGAAPPIRVFQLHNTYLVAETEQGMLIVDQHALHERVLYEDLRRRLADGSLESQRLLIPAVIDLTDAELAFLDEHREHMLRLGIEFERFGSRSIGVQAFPTLLGNRTQPERVIRDLLAWAADAETQPNIEDVLDELLHRMACHAAVKAGEVLRPEEMQALLARRHLAEQSATCPHGRPTTLVLTRGEIERQFKRDYRSLRPQEDDTIPF